MPALYSAATGMNAQQTNMDVISNNLANVDTNGFKKSRADFQDLMYQTKVVPGASTGQDTNNPTGLQVGTGVKTVGTKKLFSQGNFKDTSNPLDVAIEGNGFFQIQLPDGTTAYTRNGSFKLDNAGNVVNSDGYKLLPEIVIPEDATQISIGVDGIVNVLQAGATAMTQVGQIELTNFVNPAGLHSLGDNNYINTGASGDPINSTPGLNGLGQTRQQFVEMSNVQLVEEMTDLITGQRAYEANSKAIVTSDEMLQTVNGLKR